MCGGRSRPWVAFGFFGDRGQVGTWKSVILLPLGGGSINPVEFSFRVLPGTARAGDVDGHSDCERDSPVAAIFKPGFHASDLLIRLGSVLGALGWSVDAAVGRPLPCGVRR